MYACVCVGALLLHIMPWTIGQASRLVTSLRLRSTAAGSGLTTSLIALSTVGLISLYTYTCIYTYSMFIAFITTTMWNIIPHNVFYAYVYTYEYVYLFICVLSTGNRYLGFHCSFSFTLWLAANLAACLLNNWIIVVRQMELLGCDVCCVLCVCVCVCLHWCMNSLLRIKNLLFSRIWMMGNLFTSSNLKALSLREKLILYVRSYPLGYRDLGV